MGNETSRNGSSVSALPDLITEIQMREYADCNNNGFFPKSKLFELQQRTDSTFINPFPSSNSQSAYSETVSNIRSRGVRVWYNSTYNEKPVLAPDIYLSVEYTGTIVILFSKKFIDQSSYKNDEFSRKDTEAINYVLALSNKNFIVIILDGTIHDFKTSLLNQEIDIDFLKSTYIVDLSSNFTSFESKIDKIYDVIHTTISSTTSIPQLPSAFTNSSPIRPINRGTKQPQSDSKIFRDKIHENNENSLMSQSLTNPLNELTVNRPKAIPFQPVRPASSNPAFSRVPSRKYANSTVVSENISLADLTIEQVASLLQNLNMNSFVNVFSTNEIDGKTLTYLDSPDDLIDIGITFKPKAKLLFDVIEGFKLNGVPNSYLATLQRQRSKSAGIKLKSDKSDKNILENFKNNSSQVTDIKPKYMIGTRVLANYMKSGKWCSGTITNFRKTKQNVLYEVTYDDKELEKDISEESLHLPIMRTFEQLKQLTVGKSVLVNYKGWGKWYPGTIQSVNVLDSTTKGSIFVYSILYDDGEKESLVYEDRIQINKKKRNSSKISLSIPVGSKVEGNFKNRGVWQSGEVIKSYYDVESDMNLYDIRYDNGIIENKVLSDRIRLSTNIKKIERKSTLENTMKSNGTLQELPIPIGCKIEANYKSKGKWYSGIISKSSYHKQTNKYFYDIIYDDGDQEKNVPKDNIRYKFIRKSNKSGYKVNESVEINLKAKGKWIVGKIIKIIPNLISNNELYEVEIDNQRVQLDSSYLRKIYSINDKVERLFKGKWNKGIINEAEYSNKLNCFSYSITYDDGHTESNITGDEIRSIKISNDIQIGSQVKGNYENKGEWLLGTVSKIGLVNNSIVFDINYDDGKFEKEIPLNRIKLHDTNKSNEITSKSESSKEDSNTDDLVVGSKIIGNYQGKNRWFPGTIVRALKLSKTNTYVYDIIYDDGEVETAITKDYIKLIDNNSSNIPNVGADDDIYVPIPNGTRVEGNYHDLGEWLPGAITNSIYQEKNERFVYDILYDNGIHEKGVYIDAIRHLNYTKKDINSDDGKEDDIVDITIDDKVSSYLENLQTKLKSKHSNNLTNLIESIYLEVVEPNTIGLDKKLFLKVIDILEGPKPSNDIVDKLFETIDKSNNSLVNYKMLQYFCTGTIGTTINSPEKSKNKRNIDGDSNNEVKVKLNRHLDNQNNESKESNIISRKDEKDSKDLVMKLASTENNNEELNENDKKSESKSNNGNDKLSGKDQIEELIDFIEDNSSNEIIFSVDDRVECNYKGKGRWFSGKISKVRDDGCYNIIYDDGESEIRIEKERLRKSTNQ